MDMMLFDVMIQHGRPIAPVIYTIIIISNIESIAIKGCFSNQTTFIEVINNSGHRALPGILHTMYSHTLTGTLCKAWEALPTLLALFGLLIAILHMTVVRVVPV